MTAGLPSSLPRLETPRLVLRPFTLADGPEVQRLAGDRAIAATTLGIPHPYPDGAAEEWILRHEARFAEGGALTLAVTRRTDGQLIGAVGLELVLPHARAELGYWIGKPFWGQGYATEAARAVVGYAFEVLGLNRIHAGHLANNPASGRVMAKLGMTREGCAREHVNKWGHFADVERWAILRREFRFTDDSAG